MYFLNIETSRDLVSLIQSNPWIQKFESSLPWFHRNLDLREKILIANTPELEATNTLMSGLATPAQLKAAINRIVGLDLSGRDLRFANFDQTKLWRANLRNSNLKSTNLNWSQLQSADLQQAQLQGAKLSAARIWGADLYSANLQGADLTSAELQGTKLVGADLRGANLRDSKLQGADIDVAHLHGANLSNADLRGVEFWESYLLGANFSSAVVGSANFGNSAHLGLNDWRKILVTSKFTKKDLIGWQNSVLPFILDTERAKRAEESLKNRLDTQTSFGELDGYDEFCMTDGKILALQVCKNIENAQKYFESLESYLARLICDEDEFGEKSDFISEGIAKRLVGSEMNLFNPVDQCSEVGVDCIKFKKLAENLLKACSGKFYLSTDTRISLTRYISDSPDQYSVTKAAP